MTSLERKLNSDINDIKLESMMKKSLVLGHFRWFYCEFKYLYGKKMFVSYFIAEVRKKFALLCFITLGFVALGIIIGLNTKEVWSSKALLRTPTYNDISSLSRILKNISSIDHSAGNEISQKYIFQQFLTHVNSTDNKIEYLKSIGVNIGSLETEKTIKVIATLDEDLIEVTFLSDSAQEAKVRLEEYLDFISKKVNKELVDYVESVVGTLSTSLAIRSKIENSTASYKLKDEKAKLQISSDIAKNAGQTEPISDPGVKVDLPITLGYNLLNSQLIEYKNNPYNVFLDDFEIKSKVEALEMIKADSVNIQPFQYQLSPQLPEHRSAPSLKKYLILAILLSMLVSSAIVLYGIRDSLIEGEH